MEFQSHYAKTEHEVERQGMEERFGWETAMDQPPASFRARSKPPLLTTIGLCFPPSLASFSTLDSSLKDVECWRVAMPEKSSHDASPVENRPFADERILRGGNASQKFASENRYNTVKGHNFRSTDQEMKSDFQDGQASWESNTSSGNSFLPNPISEHLHNNLIPFQDPRPWQVVTEEVSPSEVFTAFENANRPMMVPAPSASNSYTASCSQSLGSATEYHSPISQSNTSPMDTFSSVFMFGSSGANIIPFNTSYVSSMGAFSSRFFLADQIEEPDVLWTEIKAPSENSFLQSATDAKSQLEANPPLTPNSLPSTSAGTLSRIHLPTPPHHPRPLGVPPTMKELIVNFETSHGLRSSKRKRKVFAPAERKKVKKVRENGACFTCRAKKVACTEAGICIRCLQAAKQDQQLACHICLRSKFKDIYIGVKNIHGSLLARKEQLNDIFASLTGTAKEVVIWVGSGPNIARLHLQVKQCQQSSTWATCRWKCLKKENSIYITNHFMVNQRYVIMPSSVPSIDQLELFGRKVLSFSDGTHSGNITPLLDHFLLHYCRPYRRSRLVSDSFLNDASQLKTVKRDLANGTLRIASLNGLVAYGFINLHDGSYDLLSHPPSENERYVSETIHDQIRLRAAEGFEVAEKHIFHELDNLRDIVGSYNHNRIVAGICLLRLIVLYRERMVRDEIRLGLPRHGKRRTGHQARLEKAAIMYKRLTVVYGTLCSGIDSPMAMGWQSESNVKAEELDQTLKTAFVGVQAAYVEFCDEKLTQQHDDVFKRLIVEPGRKVTRKASKRKEKSVQEE